MDKFRCETCGQGFFWSGEWWTHASGGADHMVVPPPPEQLPEPVAEALAVLTGESLVDWRERELVWPDVPPVEGLSTIHAGGLVRWRIDRAPTAPGGKWTHIGSSSALRTTDPYVAWRHLWAARLVSGERPTGLTAVREVIRMAAGRAPYEACQRADMTGLAGGILSSGTRRPPL